LSLKKLVYLDGQKAVLYRSRMNPSLGWSSTPGPSCTMIRSRTWTWTSGAKQQGIVRAECLVEWRSAKPQKVTAWQRGSARQAAVTSW
jgi:hypothetical protein